MGTIDPIKSNFMVECNRAMEEFWNSKRLKGIEEINVKKFRTYAEAIHVDEVDIDNHNWDNLWGIDNTLLSDIVEENRKCIKRMH